MCCMERTHDSDLNPTIVSPISGGGGEDTFVTLRPVSVWSGKNIGYLFISCSSTYNMSLAEVLYVCACDEDVREI